jgi:DNA-binding transcriptional regulator YdaS (Cro superfamily)
LKLSEWLKKNKMTTSAFARQIGINKMTLFKHLWRKQRMSVRIALKVEEATNGEITAKELVFYEE